MRLLPIALACLPALHIQIVLAADISDGASRIARDARIDTRATREFKTESLQLAQPTINFTIGGAYTKDENDAKIFNIPFDLGYKTTGSNWWKFQIAGDGYTRITAPGSLPVDGIADLRLNLTRQVMPSVLATVGISIPTKGAIGTQNTAQHGRLLMTNDIGSSWSYVAFVGLKHYNGAYAGLSKYRTTGYAELNYNIDENKTILINIVRSGRSGAGASTYVGLGFDSPSPWTDISSAVSITRGLTRGSRETGVEVDFTYRF